MDDKSIVSSREHEVEEELEAERRQANKGTGQYRDERGTATTDAAAPNEMAGGAGVDRTTPAGGLADPSGAVTPELEESGDYAGAGPGDAHQRGVDADERPGETFTPRSG